MLRRRTITGLNGPALLVLAVLLASATAAPKRLFKNDAQAADSFQQKVERIQENASRPQPRPETTKFSQEEINAYFAQRRMNMPEGVKSVTFDLKKDEVTAFTRVDFEQLRRSRPSMNPLLAIFDGMHDCEVVALTENAGPGMVHVRIESVTLDGVTVPRMALELFLKNYVKPKYPNIGLDNDYRLPARIDSAVIDEQEGTVVQK